MQQYRPSTDALGNPDVLRQRLAEDGYLYLPGLLPVERVLGVRHEVLRTLAEAGWLEEGSDPLDAKPGPARTDRDEDWWDGYVAVLALEAFNRLAHEPALVDLIRTVLGEPIVVHPQKIARITFPGTNYPTLPHQDFALIQGSGDTLTTWIPLGDCPAKLGGLQVLAGSHKEGLRSVTAAPGVGGLTVEGVEDDDPRWRTAERYAAGDVLLVHCLTVHAAPPNEGDRLRLSADFRFQSAQDPIAPGALLPTAFGGGHAAGWWQLTKGWSSTRWCEVAHPIRVVRYDKDPLRTPLSRFAESA